uniref:LRAT domain-containing protein n=1 Tax=Pundamilia nyererei TaxID=303518 RepID=A0A3B4H1G7_9CICH
TPAPLPETHPGDLIEISRGLYAHWAVYVGDDFVVHFGVPGNPGSKAVSSQTVEGRVMKEKLESVAGKDKWQVKNSLDGKYKPRLAKEIVKDALASVGKARKYNLKESNCEHFANEMRYGVAVSQQVATALPVGIFGSLVIGVSALARAAVKASTN